MNCVYGFDQVVMEWVAKRIKGGGEFKDYTTIGITEGGILVAGAIYNNFYGFSVEFHGASEAKIWEHDDIMEVIMAKYPFEQLGVERMTAICSRHNMAVRKRMEWMGFKVEGTIRKGWDGKVDAMIFGMLRRECRWLKQTKAA